MRAFQGLADSPNDKDLQFAVLISADAEWQVVKPLFTTAVIKTSPYGEYFFANIDRHTVLFFREGGVR